MPEKRVRSSGAILYQCTCLSFQYDIQLGVVRRCFTVHSMINIAAYERFIFSKSQLFKFWVLDGFTFCFLLHYVFARKAVPIRPFSIFLFFLSFWAAAPEDLCPVGHKGEFQDIRLSVHPTVRLPSVHQSIRPPSRLIRPLSGLK